jgi:hypothetical protein
MHSFTVRNPRLFLENRCTSLLRIAACLSVLLTIMLIEVSINQYMFTVLQHRWEYTASSLLTVLNRCLSLDDLLTIVLVYASMSIYQYINVHLVAFSVW